MINSFWHPTPANQSDVKSPSKLLKNKGRNYYSRLRMFHTIKENNRFKTLKPVKFIPPPSNVYFNKNLRISKYPSHGNILKIKNF